MSDDDLEGWHPSSEGNWMVRGHASACFTDETLHITVQSCTAHLPLPALRRVLERGGVAVVTRERLVRVEELEACLRASRLTLCHQPEENVLNAARTFAEHWQAQEGVSAEVLDKLADAVATMKAGEALEHEQHVALQRASRLVVEAAWRVPWDVVRKQLAAVPAELATLIATVNALELLTSAPVEMWQADVCGGEAGEGR